VGRSAAWVQAALIVTAFLCLMQSYIVSDFSVATVAANSHTLKPMLYKVTGTWANHEGSMVLWVMILALYGLAVAAFGANLPPSFRARVIAVQGMVGAGFLAFILFTSNPFLRLDPAPVEGNGLNPLLQDPGLAFHPPFLYLGYVGFSIAFSFAVAALIEGRVDPAWARWVRPWTLAAWCALTIGIALGSWWAYYELGWGGFWFWDPVENASLMPWIIGTALLHSATVMEKRDALRSWTVLLAITAFAFSLLGTFLVRSGVLTSVHSFAVDPARGVFILGLLIAVIGGGFTLYALRAPALKGGGLFAPISREGALVFNNLMLVTLCAVVFLGTLYPLIADAITGMKVSVGPPFFRLTFVPLAAPVLIAAAVGPMLAWKRGDLAGALGRLKFAAAFALAIAGIAWALEGGKPLALLGLAIAAWLIGGAITDLVDRIFRGGSAWHRARALPRSAWGTAMAHAGLGIVVAGITASSVWQQEAVRAMKPGDALDLAGYHFVFERIAEVRGPNYTATRGEFRVTRDGRAVAIMEPEKRFYPAEGSATTEAAIHTTWLADLYLTVGERQPDGAWPIHAFHNPLVPWIWGGAIFTALGGVVSLTDRRHRVGAPVRAARAAART
jgi:cytochrome c-type biogenesis protein CcmF